MQVVCNLHGRFKSWRQRRAPAAGRRQQAAVVGVYSRRQRTAALQCEWSVHDCMLVVLLSVVVLVVQHYGLPAMSA